MKIKHPLYNKEDQNKGISGAQDTGLRVKVISSSLTSAIFQLYGDKTLALQQRRSNQRNKQYTL